MTNSVKIATFGGGCFWCTEAIFNQVKGVVKVISGYMGGTVPGRPTYREVCSGLTGHAEVVQVHYNNTLISYKDLVVIFMTTHSPTTRYKQGSDKDTQYRSVIFYKTDAEKTIAQQVVNNLQRYFDGKIVTEISKAQVFYNAEQEHQNYYKENPQEAYCSYAIKPKLAKLRQLHADKLKQNTP